MVTTVAERFHALESSEGASEYNYGRYRPSQAADELRRTIVAAGLAPGDQAPDFELLSVDRRTLRLSALRGTPVLLRFGSPS